MSDGSEETCVTMTLSHRRPFDYVRRTSAMGAAVHKAQVVAVRVRVE